MKKYDENDLLDAIGEIDEKYIRESEGRSASARVMKYSSAVAACLALALITGASLYSAAKREDPPTPPAIVHTTEEESTQTDTTTTGSFTMSESITESESESESITESETVTEQSTETESEAVTPTEPPKPTEPTEPEPPRTEPEESTSPPETYPPVTEEPSEDKTLVPVSPSGGDTDEPQESHPVVTVPTTNPNGTMIIVTQEDGVAVTGTDGGIDQTNTVTEQTAAPTLPATTPPTPDIPPETTPDTTRPSGGGNSFDEGTDDPGENEYEKYYTGVAPNIESSKGVSAHYLTRIPEWVCKPENIKSTTEDKVFGSCTDIFSGSIANLKSVEITMYESVHLYVSVIEVKLNGEIFRNSGDLNTNKTVRILLPHGVNITDEGLYDAEDIAGLLGETELLENGYGVFCVDRIENKKLVIAEQFYNLSAIADYVLDDGMNDLILSNGYYTFFNENTYSNLVEKLGQTPSMGDIIDYFNELKKDGHI